MQMRLFGYTSLGDRSENEDSYACGEMGQRGIYAIVADGLGGHGGGKAASGLAAESLLQCSQHHGLPSEQQIIQQLELANQRILEKRNGPRHMKTTAVALYTWNDKAVWAHIGDSRLYHFYNGDLADATRDHSVCEILVKMGQLTRKEIPNHPDKNKIIKVLGEENITPEVHSVISLNPGHHAFLLCSDGLWERLDDDEIMLDLNKSDTPEQWLAFLRGRAEKRRSVEVDNNTAVAVFIEV